MRSLSLPERAIHLPPTDLVPDSTNSLSARREVEDHGLGVAGGGPSQSRCQMTEATLVVSQFLTEEVTDQACHLVFGHAVSVEIHRHPAGARPHSHGGGSIGDRALDDLQKVVVRRGKAEVPEFLLGLLGIQSERTGRLFDSVVGQIVEEIFKSQFTHVGKLYRPPGKLLYLHLSLQSRFLQKIV